MKRILLPFTLLFLLQLVSASEIVYCNTTVGNCPEDLPCCSSSGQCGNGSYCLGGCDPRFSFNNTACLPQPICQSGHFDFTTDKLQSTTDYLGNASEYSWVYDGHILDYDDGMILALPKQKSGTVVSSAFFVWYGKVSFKFKTSHGGGVVSAAILFSNVQDEVDLEFIGSTLEEPQTNYYYQGILSLTHGKNLSTSDTNSNWHTYELDWTEDQLTWGIDGEVGRTLKKSDLKNETTGEYMYPQTPSRIQISIWPGGDEDNAPGTIAWAGGAINWDMSEFTDPGYLYAQLDSVDVECYDVPDGTDVEDGANAYMYMDDQDDWTADTVKLVKANTMLGDLAHNGLDPGLEEEEEEEDQDSTSTQSDDGDDETSSSGGSNTKDNSKTTKTEGGDGTTATTKTKKGSSTSTEYTDFIQDTRSTSTAGANSGKFAVVSSISGLVFLLGSCLYLL